MNGARTAMFAACAITLSGVASTATAQDVVTDGGFDVQGGSLAAACYFPNCPTGAWSGESGGGLVDSGNSAWQSPATISPPVAALVQRTGKISQSFTVFTAGRYRVVASISGRQQAGGSNGDQTVLVIVNGVAIGSWATSSGASYQRRTSSAISLTAGPVYMLELIGQASTDSTAFIDDVRLVPDEATMTYQYDALGRLVAVKQQGGFNDGVQVGYTFDRAGNRTRVRVVGSQ